VVGGSSPRLRGTRLPVVSEHHQLRFIPAPAGNASVPSARASARTVHPRACGERRFATFHAYLRAGSSPRLRGTREQRRHGCRDLRFIPAPAGNALAGTLPFTSRTVHPRACGERFFGGAVGVLSCGSSPRLRGTQPRMGCSWLLLRFIPAPAGNAFKGAFVPTAFAVHFRACGERMTLKALSPH